jgi:hypothetical protein
MNHLLAWRALTAQPLRFVDHQSLRGCFAQVLSDRAIGEMTDSARFSARLLELLMAHFQLAPLASLTPVSEDDLPVLLLSPTAFSRLPRLCGAVWHAAALSREVRGAVVSEWREQLGPEVFNLALQHREWAGAANLLHSPSALLVAIDRDGQACVADWFAAQPAPLQAWLQLRLPQAALDSQTSRAEPAPTVLPNAVGDSVAVGKQHRPLRGQASLPQHEQHLRHTPEGARLACEGAGKARNEAPDPQRIELVRRLAVVVQATLDQPSMEPADVPA